MLIFTSYLPRRKVIASFIPTATDGIQEIIAIVKLTLYVTKLLYLKGNDTAMSLSKAMGMRTNIKELLREGIED